MVYSLLVLVLFFFSFFFRKLSGNVRFCLFGSAWVRMILHEPLVRTPFTDMAAAMFTRQTYSDCDQFEMKFASCLEAYGRPAGDVKCAALKEDFGECVFRFKQVTPPLRRTNRNSQLTPAFSPTEGPLPGDAQGTPPPAGSGRAEGRKQLRSHPEARQLLKIANQERFHHSRACV